MAIISGGFPWQPAPCPSDYRPAFDDSAASALRSTCWPCRTPCRSSGSGVPCFPSEMGASAPALPAGWCKGATCTVGEAAQPPAHLLVVACQPLRHVPIMTLRTPVARVSLGHRARPAVIGWLRAAALCQRASHAASCHAPTQAAQPVGYCANMALCAAPPTVNRRTNPGGLMSSG